MSQLLLSKHVFMALCGEYAVLLDVHSDSYFTLPLQENVSLSGRVAGWPAYQGVNVCDTIGGREIEEQAKLEEQTITELRTRRVLTADLSEGKAIAPVQLQRPTSSIFDHVLDSRISVKPSLLGEVAVRAVQAYLSLRMGSIESVIDGLSELRNARGAARGKEVRDLNSLASAYINARPLIFSAYNACLLDSIVLTRLLISRGIPAQLCFGVRVNPFAAHSWVQVGACVVNDALGRVLSYQPIMCA